LTVFVDANYGQHCNVSSNKGFQQILTINHIPNVKLGLRIFDTCHDRIIVFRQVLRVVVEQSCAPDYEMGILMLSQYGPMMEYLLSYNGLPIGIYEERDFTVPIINILAHYLSTKYKIVDLVHANTDSVLDDFLEVIKDADLIPSESYVIKPEISRFDLGEFSSAGEFLENCNNLANHSPYLLDVEKAVIKLAEVFQDFRKRNCSIDEESSIMTQSLYHITTKEILHGNLVFTIVLVLVNLFILLTALPFCVTDDYFGTENLNAWKILLTTLGLIFSIMLSRALFLTLSTGGVFIHINGYLQSLMALLAYGVQIAMSVMYFVLSTTNSAVVIRSLIFIALLGYDIFLLIALFVTCYFIIQIQHNYHEEKYFFRTSIGLLIIWRIYYIMRTPKRKNLGQRFDPVNLLTDSTVNTIIRQELRLQSCSSHDYVYPARESQILRMPSAYSNYYGNLSSNSKYFKRCRSPNHYEMPTYNNYECYAKMKEIDAAYVTLRIRMYILNLENFFNFQFLATNNVIYAKPKIYKFQRISLEERSNTETTCNRDNSSPVSRQHIEMYSIRYTSPTNILRERKIDEEEENEEEEEEDEKDQEDEGASRITRF
ncbi:Protein bride of sevenless, partial [Trachymyrmex cornetzi]